MGIEILPYLVCLIPFLLTGGFIRRRRRYLTSSPPAEFRALQKGTGMVISGSAAIQVLENEIWEESDLDLYVEHPNVGRVADFVLSNGHTPSPAKNKPNRPTERCPHPKRRTRQRCRIPMTLSLEHHSGLHVHPGWEEGPDHLDPLSRPEAHLGFPLEYVARGPTILSALAHHTAVVMNLITHSTIYSLYPHATFQSGLNLHLMRDGREADQQTARAKYDQRGWTTVHPFDTVGREQHLGFWAANSWALETIAVGRTAGINAQFITATLRLPSSEVVCVFDVQLANVLERIMPKLLAQLGGSEDKIFREVITFFSRRRSQDRPHRGHNEIGHGSYFGGCQKSDGNSQKAGNELPREGKACFSGTD
ncbi:hypothetical protein B0H14DRAFT_2593024 [Mycena olivaceomarginata]|nr:hypothetical protein B0H14DRAFT_2593024 [Mycena olivaceomarginata]